MFKKNVHAKFFKCNPKDNKDWMVNRKKHQLHFYKTFVRSK